MAGKKKDIEKSYKAVAKQFIKYGGNHLVPGQEFEVRESSVEELKQFADITISEEKDNEDNGQDSLEGECGGDE
nr:MAG TPA: hypothetical protein [Caudoviricetes sp.]